MGLSIATKQSAEEICNVLKELLAYDEAREAVFAMRRSQFQLVAHSSTASEENENKSVTASKGGDEDMPLQISYTDGSFRVVRKTGLLQYRFMIKGKQNSVYGKTKTDCYMRRFEVENYPEFKEKKQTKVKKVEKISTYKHWAEEWYELYKVPNGHKTSYLKAIKTYLKNNIYPAIGNMLLTDITTLMLQKLIVSIKSASTRTKVAAVLSESFRDAFANQKTKFNPYIDVKFVKYKQPKLGAPTHAQQLSMLAEVEKTGNKKMLAFTKALLMTGMRQGELNTIQLKDIDFVNLEIRVETSWDNEKRELTTTKTESSERILPIAPPLLEVLQPHIEACKKDDDFLFGYEDANYTRRFLSKICKRLQIPFTGHSTGTHL